VNPLFDETVRRLSIVLGLSREQAERALLELCDSMSLDVDAYILARHAELQAQGITNPEIYERIAAELPQLRFKTKPISARQIRRRIYG
jgi:hypothetical protein